MKKPRTRYVNRNGQGQRETVDAFPFDTKEDRAEARRCVREYNLADPTARHYLSSRACKEWKE